MSIEKERLSSVPFLPNWTKKEHEARFIFAASFCQNKDVLDCACGSGMGVQYFSKKSKSVQAIDISKTAIDEARKRIGNKNSKVTFSQGSALDIPLSDASVDIYISLETIEHLYDDHAYLKEAHRVLRPGGTFICSTPNRTVTNPGKTISDKPANPFHIREYSTYEFQSLCRNYFPESILFAQNPVSSFVTKPLNLIGKFSPFHSTTRIYQLFKLATSIFRTNKYYSVRTAEKNIDYEYVTLVCAKKDIY